MANIDTTEGKRWKQERALIFGRTVAAHRDNGENLRLTHRDLRRRINGYGYAMHPNAIAEIEQGVRTDITVSELSLIARSLSVAPLALLFPSTPAPIEHLPGRYCTRAEARAWFAGHPAQFI